MGMRTWFITKEARAKARAAHLAGKMAAAAMSEGVDRFLACRYTPQVGGYLKVFEGQLFKCLNPTTAPPVVLALIEYSIFIETIRDLKERMTADTVSAMSPWLETVGKIDLRHHGMLLINGRIKDFQLSLVKSGLQLFIAKADGLRAADKVFRFCNPAIAARFPVENLPTHSLGD
jgi:hypothetical protein